MASILVKTSHPSAQPLEQSFDSVCVSQGSAGYYQQNNQKVSTYSQLSDVLRIYNIFLPDNDVRFLAS